MTFATLLLDATTSAHHAAQAYAHGPHGHHPHFGGLFLGVGLTLLTLFLVRAFVRRRFFRHGRRRMIHHVFRRLDTSPSQEKVIREALDSLRERAGSLRGEGANVRQGLSRAVAGEAFDPSAVEAAFAVPTQKLPELRDALAAALARVHEVLTPGQRKELAAMIDAGPRVFFFRHARRRC